MLDLDWCPGCRGVRQTLLRARSSGTFQARPSLLSRLALRSQVPQLRIHSQARHQADVWQAADQLEQVEHSKAAIGDKDDRAVRQPARHQLKDLPGPLSQFLMLAPALSVVAFRRAEHRQEGQAPNATGPRHTDQQQTAQPTQAARFDKVRTTRPHRIAVDASGTDLLPTPPLNRVIQAADHFASRREGCDQQVQPDLTGGQGRPARPIQNAMIVLKRLLCAQPADAQTGGDGALANGQDRSSQQDLSVFPNGLGKQRRKLYYQGQQLDRQCQPMKTSLAKVVFSLRGLSFSFKDQNWIKSSEEGARKSIDYFNQALAKDPNYALAYHGLSDAYQLLGQIGFRPNEIYPKALAYAERALAIDPTLPEAHLSRGACELWYGWNWTMAEQELKRAMALNPNLPDPHDLYGQFLSGMGRFDEAIAENKRALELDPLSPIRNSNLWGVYYWARQYDLAIEQSRKVMELDPNFSFGPLTSGLAYGQQGKYPEAIAQLIKARDLPGGFAPATSELGYVYAVSGQRTKAQELLRELQERAKREFIDPYYIAIIHVGLGDAEQTFVWLNKAYEERSIGLLWLKVEPKFDRLRLDPRFTDLVRHIGLSP